MLTEPAGCGVGTDLEWLINVHLKMSNARDADELFRARQHFHSRVSVIAVVHQFLFFRNHELNRSLADAG